MSELSRYLFPGIVLIFFGFRFLNILKIKKNIPLNVISEQHLSKIPKDKQIILCCASGVRSAIPVSAVKRLGYEKVVNSACSQ